MNDYILDLEHLYCEMADHDLNLPDTILAFKLLDGARTKDCPHVKNIKQQSANVTESDGQQANDKGYEEDELILLVKELPSQLATVMTEFINFFS